MSWHTVQLADLPPQPWKNGGGLTRELLAWPSAADWRVRLSVADITADGPFSSFEGVQRWFAVLEGDGVCLTVDGTAAALCPASPAFVFAGAANTDCKLLGGPTRDLNLMLRGATGQMRRVQGDLQGDTENFHAQNATNIIAVYAINMRTIARFDQDTCLLEPGTLAWRCVAASPAGAGAAWSVQSDNALCMEISA